MAEKKLAHVNIEDIDFDDDNWYDQLADDFDDEYAEDDSTGEICKKCSLGSIMLALIILATIAIIGASCIIGFIEIIKRIR
jgi:hypothetical protein